MDRKAMLLKGMMSNHISGQVARKVPYLISPDKKPEDYSDQERIWLKKRDERRKGHVPCGWWNYFLECVEVKIRDGDSLALWLSSSGDKGTTTLPFILFLHGGGYSGLTWAPIVDELSRLIVAEYGALDLRGHGESDCQDERNLSIQTLTQDVMDAINWMRKSERIGLGRRPLILVGHSMGGALAVNVCLKLQETDQVKVSAMAVLDVVEGSAMMALKSMHFVLKNRPQEFASLPEAIQWCTQGSGQTKNLDSARVSIPGQLKLKATGQLATQFVNRDEETNGSCDNHSVASKKKRIWEKGQIPANSSDPPHEPKDFEWRINLSDTEPFWTGWFEGLSKKFLEVRCPKLLMLAGIDRLDKELTVGQMQGKFQMQVFHNVGHAVHEDVPDKAAECVASFLCRQRIVTAKGHLPAALPGC